MPLTMPTSPGFSACRFGLETNTQTFTSPLTRNTQRALLGGARWTASYTLPATTRAQMADWQAFLLGLEGGVNTFYGFDPDARLPRGAASGTPLVNGAGQTGSTLAIDGTTPSVLNWARAGDYFQVGTELKMLTQPASTNALGQAVLSFKPALRAVPVDNAPITFVNPVCVMALVDDGQSMWQSGKRLGIYDSFSFSAVEVF